MNTLEQPASAGYNKRGISVNIDDDECLAKCVGKRYYIRMNGLTLYDPKGSAEGMGFAYDDNRGKRVWEFKTVTSECFALYLQYLKEGRGIYLRHAQRCM